MKSPICNVLILNLFFTCFTSLIVLSYASTQCSSSTTLEKNKQDVKNQQAKNCQGCNAYDCFEDKAQCGSDSYLMKYGYKYCRRFFDAKYLNLFEPNGEVFLACTRTCMLDFLDEYKSANSTISCSHVQEEAFKTHMACSKKCKFCEACKENKIAFIHSFDYLDLISYEMATQIFKLIYECGIFFPCFTWTQVLAIIIANVSFIFVYKQYFLLL